MISQFSLAVSIKYPNLVFGDDWYFKEDGQGPTLAKWPEDIQPPSPEEIEEAANYLLASEERAWRDSELLKADIEVNKAADTASVSEQPWRQYRVALRDWPQSVGFPDASARPARPDYG